MARIHTFVPRKDIEAGTLVLIAGYERRYCLTVTPPIPVEEILEAHLGLAYDFDDLPKLVNEPDALGGLWFRSREVKFDQSLDPTMHPSQLGRYRFTVAHETGHWELHRDVFLSNEGQVAMFEAGENPVICRSNDKSPLEWQADAFAGYLLMPKDMVFAQWEAMHGNRQPYIAIDEIEDLKSRWGLADDDRPTVDVARQMAPVFEVSAQAMQIRLIELGLIRTKVPEPGLFS
ncbi:MAG TPA: ImmA/IrrE family metallo-endopeptidase [Candidatus Krumholzibacteria bacterium]|nr:ImmA/IrrE family metallo-endopeptidase [Candidatus Krumholzibacteria bacterium]